MSYVLILLLIWAVAMAAWFVVSKYFKSSDVQRIKDRLAGTALNKKAAKKKARETSQSVIHIQDKAPSRLAQMVVDKYKLGPKIEEFLEQAGLRWAPARLVHLCLMAFVAGLAIAWLMLPIPRPDLFTTGQKKTGRMSRHLAVAAALINDGNPLHENHHPLCQSCDPPAPLLGIRSQHEGLRKPDARRTLRVRYRALGALRSRVWPVLGCSRKGSNSAHTRENSQPRMASRIPSQRGCTRCPPQESRCSPRRTGPNTSPVRTTPMRRDSTSAPRWHWILPDILSAGC